MGATSKGQSGVGTILMVDDTPANLAIAASHLESQGFKVLVAQDGEEALERVGYGKPDLILLDVMLPSMDGFEVCRRLKANPATRHIPVIFMTALDQTDGKLAAFQTGAVDYVTKPFDIAELMARVHIHLSLSALQQELQEHNVQLEHEVAERRKTEADLQVANAELDSFAHAVSHDLRGPLRSMRGFAQILVADYGQELASEARDYLKEIIHASQEMGEMIEGLLQLSRNTRGDLERQEIDLTALAEDLRRELERSAPERRVDWLIEAGVTAQGDARLVELVMRNLLDNAWKYTAAAALPQIHFYTEEEGEERRFCVADNGAGFDMRLATKLFKPFQRLHREEEFPGLGIGLATVRRIIHRHGGSIDVTAEKGRGAIFCFTLPTGKGDREP